MQEVLDTLISFAKAPIQVEVDPTRMRPLDSPGLIADNRKIVRLGWSPTIAMNDELLHILEDLRSH